MNRLAKLTQGWKQKQLKEAQLKDYLEKLEESKQRAGKQARAKAIMLNMETEKRRFLNS